jgi:DNA-binding helix-hairpin-helix protein with protein kinase domain
MQFKQYLQQQFISNFIIPDIGPGRKATLASFGIETAWDVESEIILDIPGFGPKLTGRLVSWRRDIESQFLFNAKAGIPPHEQQALDAKYSQARQRLETELLTGEKVLRNIHLRADSSEIRQLYEHLRLCMHQLAQAQADLSVMPPEL